jgi:hypothetical protein
MRNDARSSKWQYLAVGAAVACVAGVAAYLHFGPRTFCEAVAGGASLDELTRHMEEHDPTRLRTDGWGAFLAHTTSEPYACSYTIEDGRVVEARSH